MLQEQVQWFGATDSKTIKVNPANTLDSQVVSNTIPDTMTAGNSYNISITLKNTGSKTWTSDTNFNLGAGGDKDPFFPGDYPRIHLQSGESIAAGQTKTFSFTLKAPSTPGSYTTSWRMLQEQVQWFGATDSKTIKVNPANNLDAQVVSDTIPDTMTAGNSYNVSITLKNTGSKTWTSDTNFNLGAGGDKDPFYPGDYPRIHLQSGESIAYGQTKTFSFTLKAPSTPGSYTTSWRMLQEQVQWFGATDSKTIKVNPANTLDSQVVSDTIPDTMTAGNSYNISITLKNTGSKTWTSDTNFNLGAGGDKDPFFPGDYPRIHLQSGESIAAGQTKTFSFTLKAPSTPGSYTTSWRMLQEQVQWFGATDSKTIKVN